VEPDEQRASDRVTTWLSIALGVGAAGLSLLAMMRGRGAEVIVVWGLATLSLVVLLVRATRTVRIVIATCLLFVAVGVPLLVWWGRLSLIEAPTETEVSALFPGDVIDWNDSDDHGWWHYTMHPDSDRDPQELCEAIHAAMVERFPHAIPGTGIVISGSPGGRGAYCGMPRWWGDPNSAGSWPWEP
jgi:hypothetical protein